MRASFASLLACICLSVGSTSAALSVAASTNTTSGPPPVYDPAHVVQVITMGDQPNQAALVVAPTPGDLDPGSPTRLEIRNPYIETLFVTRPFDDLQVTTPNPGPLEIIKVKNGKRHVTTYPVRPDKVRYVYGDFMILRLRSVINRLEKSIRASPAQAEEVGYKLTHTMSNTQVSSTTRTEGWETEATVTARAEGSGALFGFGASASREFSATVRRSVTTTFAKSQATTEEVSKELSFTLRAAPNTETALWKSAVQLDVYICTTGTTHWKTNPLSSHCSFSHSVIEEGKRYEITVTNLAA